MKKKMILRSISLVLAVMTLCGCATTQADQTQNTLGTIGVLAPPDTTALTEQTVPTTVVTEPPAITAASFGELQALAAGNALISGDTVRICGEMELTEPVIFCVPIKLSVEAAVTCTCPIAFETFDFGTVEISVADGIDAAALDIRFDVPNCDVLWISGQPYGSEEQAAETLNVRSYNGIDLRGKYGLGGTGENEILSFSLTAEDNPSLDAPLDFSPEGNTLYLAVSYLTDDDTLENAVAQIVTSSGETILQAMDLTEGERLYTLTDSSGDQRTYKIITQRITYNLPVFYIEIEGGKEVTSREKYLSATLSIDTTNTAGDFPSLDEAEILIRGRGHYSWNFDKTPYKIRFEKKTSVLGMNASKNWTLLANYVDRSLIQNYVAMEMGKVMDNIPYHSSQYPVDVFVNGSYRGVYTFGEQLEAKEERIDLEESYVDVDTDYLLEVGGYDDGDKLNRDYFHAGTLRYVAIKHPDSAQLSQEQLDYLIGYVTAADNAVRTLDNYEDYIDVDSLIDWVIIHELSYNLDCCFRRSCYLIKEKGGKLKMGPIWDFDLAFGSHFRYQSGDWATVGASGEYVGVTWMNYLKKDPAFMERFTARWNEVKEELLSTALSCVDSMGALVTPSAQMNFEVWDLLGKSAPAQPSSHKKYDTYEKMLQRLRTFIQDRYDWLDAQLNG